MKSIRVMTAAEREAREQRSQARYNRIYGEVENEHGPDCPGYAIHDETMRRVELAQQDDAADAAEYRASGMA